MDKLFKVFLAELHPNNTKGNGHKIGILIKETKGFRWFLFKHNNQVIRIERGLRNG